MGERLDDDCWSGLDERLDGCGVNLLFPVKIAARLEEVDLEVVVVEPFLPWPEVN